MGHVKAFSGAAMVLAALAGSASAQQPPTLTQPNPTQPNPTQPSTAPVPRPPQPVAPLQPRVQQPATPAGPAQVAPRQAAPGPAAPQPGGTAPGAGQIPPGPITVGPVIIPPGQLPTWPLQVDSVAVQFPYLRSHCLLDANQEVDRTFIDTFNMGAGSDATILAVTVQCEGLRRLRAADESGTFELMVYTSFQRQLDPTSTKSDLAKQTCDAVMSQQIETPLSATTPKERADELFSLGQTRDQDTVGVLQTTRRACYIGFVKGKLAQVIATTSVKGRLVAIAAVAINGQSLEELRVRAGQFITRLSVANGEG